MSDQTLRLAGLAFAGSDLVFEIDSQGRIVFVLGAAARLTGHGERALTGQSWLDLVIDADRGLLDALAEGLKPAERQGPLRIALRPLGANLGPRPASLSVFRLPQLEGHLSCALTLGARGAQGAGSTRPDGLIEPDDFPGAAAGLLEEAVRAGLELRLDLVDLDGFAASLNRLPPAEAEAARQKVGATLRAASFAGAGATQVAQDRYAVLSESAASPERLEERLTAATGPSVKTSMAQLPLSAGSAAQSIRAMRYALDRYLEEGAESVARGFRATVDRTLADTRRFKVMLSAGVFQLAYQPVVDIHDASLHHFEALARFEADTSPADTIRLAEELDLIADFDMAVAKSVFATLGKSLDIAPIAVNISARSLMQPQFIRAFFELTGADPLVRARMLVEITETKRLPDLAMAQKVIAEFRRLKHLVCLDDFGAGAASPDYLSQLEVDFVKIDGRYVNNVENQPRDAVVLKHLVALCRDLGIATIAEMIETPGAAQIARDLGVTLGQGWHYAKALPEPKWQPPAPSAVPGKRRGAVERWG